MGSTRFDFEDETAVVTGGSSGIGRAIARRFGEAGATVVVADVRETPKDANAETPTHELIVEAGGAAEFVETDVSDPDAVDAVLEAAREFGGVDVMVNNAARYVSAPLLEHDLSDLDRLYRTNVRGAFVGTRAAAADMSRRGQPGEIVNVCSISSRFAQYDQAGYDLTKAAVQMLSRNAALEFADQGIRVNAVAPGQIATEFFAGWTEEAIEGAREDAFVKPVPLGRAGRPEDIAAPVLFLASDDAGYVTGETLFVDGGWSCF
jgi:NAD(P)-dependent dehydrogenase (short-subunit alcohol dehydrogenase family)